MSLCYKSIKQLKGKQKFNFVNLTLWCVWLLLANFIVYCSKESFHLFFHCKSVPWEQLTPNSKQHILTPLNYTDLSILTPDLSLFFRASAISHRETYTILKIFPFHLSNFSLIFIVLLFLLLKTLRENTVTEFVKYFENYFIIKLTKKS